MASLEQRLEAHQIVELNTSMEISCTLMIVF